MTRHDPGGPRPLQAEPGTEPDDDHPGAGGTTTLTRTDDPAIDLRDDAAGEPAPKGDTETKDEPTPTTAEGAPATDASSDKGHVLHALGSRARGVDPKQLVGGALLCLVGLGLLAGWVLHVSWTPLIDLALVAIGAVLVVQSRRGAPARPLVVLGIVLALVAAATWRAETSFDGGLGRRTIRPSVARTAAYELGTGSLTIDLTKTVVGPKPVIITGKVGAGRIVVKVPKGQRLAVRTVAGFGMASVDSKKQYGPGIEKLRAAPEGSTAPLSLVLRVGIGSVEVRRV